ncbi:adenylate/guanylate cyclase domain-containing protein [Bdellovibrionota bacterium FG-2]
MNFKQQRARLKRVLLGTLVLSSIFFLFRLFPVAEQLERFTLDFRYAHFNRDARFSDQVVILDVDEGSLKLLSPIFGRWPWPRRVYKDIIEFLNLGQPAGILFDVYFTEAQKPDEHGVSDDQILAEASQLAGNVSHAMEFLTQAETSEETSRQGIAAKLPPGFERNAVKIDGATADLPQPESKYVDFLTPAPAYLEKNIKIHSTTATNDSDGVFRHFPLFFPYETQIYPSLTLAAILMKNPSDLSGSSALNTLTLTPLKMDQKTLQIPLDSHGRLALHFYRNDPAHDPVIIPMAAVIDSASKLQKAEEAEPSKLKVNPLEFENKLILIGTSAAGLQDLKATPVNPSLPGVVLHATAISNILTQDFLSFTPPIAKIATSLILLCLSYLAVLLLNSFVLKITVPLLVICLYDLVSFYLFKTHSLALEMALPNLFSAFALVDGLAYVSFVENAEKKRMTGTLSKYLSPSVTEALIANGMNPQAEVGQKKELSILFSDIRDFTTLSESMPPEQLVGKLNTYLGRMTDEIFLFDGTLDKFIGDAIMAFWGAPLNDSDHAIKAVRCGFAMKKALTQFMSGFKVGIGINTGDCIVGNIGSDKRISYTVIGDNVNLASRIEGLTKQYHSSFLIGSRTQELVKDSILCRPIDDVKVKGKNQSVRLYEPLLEASAPDAPAIRALIESFTESLGEYKKGNFESALGLFKKTQAMRVEFGGDGPSEVYIERCQDLIQEPPKEWDGVYVAKSK